MTLRPGRQRRPSGTKWERLHLRREKREKPCAVSKDGCCTRCPPGKFLNNCTCETCKEDTYLEYEGALSTCQACDHCVGNAHQVEVKKCAPEHRRVCGCEDGYYRDNDHDTESSDFNCNRCTDCAHLNKETEKNCSEKEDAKCGDCLPKFQLQEKMCQKVKIEPPPDRSKIVYLLLCLPCLLFLGAGIACYKKKCISGTSSPVGIHTLVNSACKDTLLAAAGPASSHKSEEPTEFSSVKSTPLVRGDLLHADPPLQRSLLQGRKLYAVIDTVPVRRWKEFIRGLGLRDGEIEAVEVEHTQLREQQYEMLKRWQQQQGASLDAVFAVLEDMQLGGCAQELREQLQPSTLLPNL